MQYILITVILVSCVLLTGKRLSKNLKKTNKCSGWGCSGCSDDMSSSCACPGNSKQPNQNSLL